MLAALPLISQLEFDRIRRSTAGHDRLRLVADMCRLNTLTIVKRAGSGHLGTSFSAMDIVVALYEEVMNTRIVGFSAPDRDIYFSSKGHDVPGLYSVLFSLGCIPQERFIQLRRLGGLDGHPDIGVPGIEANSGSLGMGISKGKGMAWAKRSLRRGGRVIVMTGDGELQEGQNYEALLTAAQHRLSNLMVVVDHNKVQSDKPVSEIVDLGDLQRKLTAFGWAVERCDGHDFAALERTFAYLDGIADRPKALIADTVKGRGVSFMEHPFALRENAGLYPWHAGAPSDSAFDAAHRELLDRIDGRLISLGLEAVRLERLQPEFAKNERVIESLEGEPVSQAAQVRMSAGSSDEYVANAFGRALVALAARREDLVVLDGDLAADCRIREFETTYPDRFIENGIAEQDMVSMAGGLARQGLLPVVNSFGSFLASRANEQIYNNAGEKTRVIYVCHYAGLIPAGPGKSHQSIRDISLFGALPDFVVVQPGTARETELLLDYCVNVATGNCMMRLAIGPSPRRLLLPADYRVTPGHGLMLAPGTDALMFAYGPVMLHEALLASELLSEQGVGLAVVNLPWLNRVDSEWLESVVDPVEHLFVVDDHAPVGGLGDTVLRTLAGCGGLAGRTLTICAVEGHPACGTPMQALRYHGLDAGTLAAKVLRALRRRTSDSLVQGN
jgi:transketolase